MFLLLQRNKPMSMHLFILVKTKYMFCLCSELCILVVLKTTMELPFLMLIFAGNAFFTVVVCYSSVIFLVI